MEEWWIWPIVAVNAFTFLLFGWDKWKATRSGRRVPENQLLLCSAATGAVGGWLAMTTFRHKTRKTSFRLKMVLATAANGVWLWLWLCR